MSEQVEEKPEKMDVIIEALMDKMLLCINHPNMHEPTLFAMFKDLCMGIGALNEGPSTVTNNYS